MQILQGFFYKIFLLILGFHFEQKLAETLLVPERKHWLNQIYIVLVSPGFPTTSSTKHQQYS